MKRSKLTSFSAALAVSLCSTELVFSQDCGLSNPETMGGSDTFYSFKDLVPLNDLGDGVYTVGGNDYPGGLFPGGSNEPPFQHFQAGKTAALGVMPRDQDGEIDETDPNAKIVLLSLGLSNTSQEWEEFKELANETGSGKSSKVTIVNGAVSGASASEAAIFDSQYWVCVAERLEDALVDPDQVQVIWLKTAEGIPDDGTPDPVFPDHAVALRDDIANIARIAKFRFPNAALLYVSSRTYAGYSDIRLSFEPNAYEGGFATKWVIGQQINGVGNLNHSSSGPDPVVAPWMTWGPYLWAEGTNARSDQLTWEHDEFEDDGVHPLQAGEKKVAAQLHEFFKTNGTSKTWYLETQTALCGPRAKVNFAGSLVTGNPRLAISQTATVPTLSPLFLHAFDAYPGAAGVFIVSIQPFDQWGAGPALGSFMGNPPPVDFQFWGMSNLQGKQWLDMGEVPDSPGLCGLDFTAQYGTMDPSSPTVLYSRVASVQLGR